MYLINNVIFPLLFPIRLFILIVVALFSLFAPKFIFEYFFNKANLIVLLCLGIYPKNIIDNRYNNIDTKIIVFQHRTYADCFIINYIFGPVGYVFRNIFKNNIIIRHYIERYGGIDVSSNGNEGKTKEILKYIDNNNRKLAIAPEDITNINTRVIKNNELGIFKSGAFIFKQPIQPVTINFHDKNVIWKNLENGFEAMIPWFFKQLIAPLTYIEICLLEECVCDENMSVIQYKDDVRNYMLEIIENY